MQVSLTPKLEELIARRVKSGLYNNASEVIREALRMMFERELMKPAQEHPNLDSEIISRDAGIATGDVSPLLGDSSDRRTRDHFGFAGRRAAIARLYFRREGATQKEVNELAKRLGSSQKGFFNMLDQADRWGHEVICWDDTSRGGRVYKLIYNPDHIAPRASDPPENWKELNKASHPQGAVLKKWTRYSKG